MPDYLNTILTPEELSGVSTLALAHIGDCVYELLVRTFLLRAGRLTNSGIHAESMRYVCAPAQARAMERLLPLLTEEETAVYRRGRNTHVNSVPKHARVGDYHAATGLEALFGWLWLKGERARVNELFGAVTSGDTGGIGPAPALSPEP